MGRIRQGQIAGGGGQAAMDTRREASDGGAEYNAPTAAARGRGERPAQRNPAVRRNAHIAGHTNRIPHGNGQPPPNLRNCLFRIAKQCFFIRILGGCNGGCQRTMMLQRGSPLPRGPVRRALYAPGSGRSGQAVQLIVSGPIVDDHDVPVDTCPARTVSRANPFNRLRIAAPGFH